MVKTHIRLSEADKSALLHLQQQSGLRSKVFKRVTVLLALDKGDTIERARATVGLSYPAVSKLMERYKSVQLECLQDKKQVGRPPKIDGNQRAKITALACSKAPDGYAGWSLRLLADKIVELNYCENISHSWVGNILKKTMLNPI